MRSIYVPEYISSQSMGASFTGPTIATAASEGLCFQAVWVGATAAGTLRVQASNDGVVWTDLTFTDQVVAGPDSYLANLSGIFFQYARLAFVRTGGTGTLDADLYTKEIS